MALAQTSGGNILRTELTRPRAACPSSGEARTRTGRTARRCRTGRRRRPTSARAAAANSSTSMPRRGRAPPSGRAPRRGGRGAPAGRRGRRSGRARAAPARAAGSRRSSRARPRRRCREEGRPAARTTRAAIRTPQASPASSVPSRRYETWCDAWPTVGNASQPSTSPAAIRTFCSGTGSSSPQSGSNIVAVEPARRALEPRRVDQVRSADLGDPDRQVGVPPHERAGRAGVVEVDVREQQVPEVGQLDTVLAEALDRAAAASRPARSPEARDRPASRPGRRRSSARGRRSADR